MLMRMREDTHHARRATRRINMHAAMSARVSMCHSTQSRSLRTPRGLVLVRYGERDMGPFSAAIHVHQGPRGGSPGYVNVNMWGRRYMPPVQSQASSVGARAIVWIAETLLLATEGSSTLRPVSSSFVQFRPVSSSFVLAPSEISAPCARLRQLRQGRGRGCASASRAPPMGRRAVRR